MVPSYGPLETKQLLSETFFSPGLGFRDNRLDGLRDNTTSCSQNQGSFSPIYIRKMNQYFLILYFIHVYISLKVYKKNFFFFLKQNGGVVADEWKLLFFHDLPGRPPAGRNF